MSLSFRDFAGAIMQGDVEGGAKVLEALLALDAAGAHAAAAHFQGRMSEPDFMMKAMRMRDVVQSGSEEQLVAMLTDLFALDGQTATNAATAVLKRFKDTP